MDRKYSDMASELSGKGRYGDSMLMHVNPIEVEALDSTVPGGLPRNPDTGMPEAWIQLLIPMAMGAIGGGVTAAANDQPIWKGILAGAGMGAVTGGIGIAATTPAAATTATAAPIVSELAVAPTLGTNFLSTTAGQAAATQAPGLMATQAAPNLLASQTGNFLGEAALAEQSLASMGSELASNPLLGVESLATQSTPLAGDASALSKLGITPESLPAVESVGGIEGIGEGIGSYDPSIGKIEMEPLLPTQPSQPIEPSMLDTAGDFKDRFIKQLKNPVDAEGKAMEYGLGDYIDNPLHAMAAIGGTDMLVPYEEEEEGYPSSNREGVWASGYGDYDRNIGPSWGRY